MKTYDFEQYSADWWRVRRGVPTASDFDKIITAKTLKLSAQADGYICRLIGDSMDLLYPRGGPSSAAMKNGTDTEPEARSWYELERGVDVRQVGFCLDDQERFGASPDGLIGEDGLLELKCPEPKAQVAYLLSGTLPDDYKPQIHGQLLVTGRKWCDFLSYCPGLPPLLLRVEPDAFTEKLQVALNAFWEHLQEAKAKIRGEAA